jgi:DNA-binding HxlR family transcriptional regulator
VRFTYALTDKGKELGGVVLALVRWGTKNIPGTRTLKEFTPPTEKCRARHIRAERRR